MKNSFLGVSIGVKRKREKKEKRTLLLQKKKGRERKTFLH